jgi:hypothetical protein
MNYLKVSKRILKCDEFDAIRTFMDATKGWVLKRTLPTFTNKGHYWVSLSIVDTLHAYLTQAQNDLAPLVDAFIRVLPDRIEEARAALKGEFNLNDYKDASYVRAAFSFEWGFLSYAVPEALSPELKEQEVARFQKKLDDAAEEVRTALRTAMLDLTGKLVDRLRAKNGEDRTRFCDSAVTNLVEFLELFETRNITGDGELGELAVIAKRIVNEATPDRLRNSRYYRDKMIEKMEQVNMAIGDIVTNRRRMYTLQTED